ncbi:MAG: hypothetical protein KH416_07455 [Dialister sp.]|uniref:hypothetical protein n=1 Tax=Dialister sp. TaxID=1955814 RepID=UPI002579B38F|nr:hypothetical protein [Dialister sp.]MBS6295943.1 hypothetical protein [Dialister sp.]
MKQQDIKKLKTRIESLEKEQLSLFSALTTINEQNKELLEIVKELYKKLNKLQVVDADIAEYFSE